MLYRIEDVERVYHEDIAQAKEVLNRDYDEPFTMGEIRDIYEASCKGVTDPAERIFNLISLALMAGYTEGYADGNEVADMIANQEE